MALKDLTDTQSFALLLFIFLIRLHVSQAGSKYDLDEHEGRAVVLLLIIAVLVCLIAFVLFAFIIYKLWNGRFDNRYTINSRLEYREKDDMELKDVADGSKYSTTTTEPLYSAVNKGLKEEVVAQGNGSAVVETRVVEEELNTEEVIVSQAPPTHQAEMETQELVIVFDDNDDVVDVFTHVDT